jgi:hypothetical protein
MVMSVTKVRLPYCYKATFVKKRRKTERRDFLCGEVTAEVPDLSSMDVRIVAEWTNILFRDDGALGRTRPVTSRAVMWNGSFYVPAGEYMQDTVPRHIIKDTLVIPQDAAWHYKGIYDFETASNLFLEVGKAIRGDDDFERLREAISFGRKREPKYELPDTLIHDDRELHRRVVQQIADGLIFINGTTWKKVPSICLRLNLNQSAEAAWVNVCHGAYGYNQGRPENLKWDIDSKLHHRHFGLNEVGRLLQGIGPGIRVSWDVSKIEVISSEAVRFNGTSEYIGRAMQSAVLAHEATLGTMAGSLVEDWIGVRVALDRHIAKPDDDFHQDDINRLLRLLEADISPYSKRRNAEVSENIAHFLKSGAADTIPMPAPGYYKSDLWAR